MVVNLNFNLEAWVKSLKIEASSREDAIKKLMDMTLGEIIEEGNHQELLKLKVQYYKLYQLQYHHNLESELNNGK